jgi:hypothetical protein
MTYTYTWADAEQTTLKRDDNAFIPTDPANTDYQEYLAWLSEGNTPDPAPTPVPVAPPTPAEKLAAAGLTVEELKALLAS